MREDFYKISGLSGASSLYFISRHFFSTERTSPTLIILPSDADLTEAQETLGHFLKGKGSVLQYPQYENLYSLVKQDPEIISQRATTQAQLVQNGQKGTFVVSNLEALVQKTPSPEVFSQFIVSLKKNAWIERDLLISNLEEAGYRRDSLAEDRGFFGVRGLLVDIYTFNYKHPIRIEFFGDEIISIRFFDPETQRSLEEISEIHIVPCSEMLFKNSSWASVRERIKNFSDEQGFDSVEREKILRDLEQHREPLEPRWILPGICPDLCSLFDYFDSNLDMVFVDKEKSISLLKKTLLETEERFNSLDKLRYPLTAVTTAEEMWTDLNAHDLQSSVINGSKVYNVSHFDGLRNKIMVSKNFQPLLETIRSLAEKDIKTSLVIRNPKRILAIQDALTLPDTVTIDSGPLFDGFVSETFSTAIITEKDIFGSKRRKASAFASQTSTEDFLRQFSDLKHGDFVIHEDHGIAKFLGLQKLSVHGFENEFLVLEYQGADKLYLPVYRFDKVSRYVGEGATPRLDRLGTTDFSKRKSKVKNDILKIAHELLQIAAQRKTIEMVRPEWDILRYRSFCSEFPYDLTPDQESAINAIERDLENPWPMDRLVCGDVGFGKTEVAIRAAMLTVLQGKQVCILAPTTLLVEQLFRNFKKRFSAFGIEVQHLSRFVSSTEQKKIVESTNDGRTHILLGTHRLLQNDIKFKNIGMLIIDEEQRFGVKHKEKIKKLRTELDILTLSATPIPRTLQMSIVGIRDLSLIVTPPENREEVKTYVGVYDETLIASAIEKERSRGGQIIIVHNRVRSIEAFASRIQNLAPDLNISIVHGQLPEELLEKRMMDFISQKAQVIVATSIIENGLDIPSANTLIVDHAEMFGLSELYQLRGRVGRSHHTASAYFLVHETTELTVEASKRLQVLAACTALGSGFRISTHDMEIRGAGNLLGEEQSGVVAEVGLELYTQMLEETLADITSSSHLDPLPEVNSGYSAFIPEAYLPDAIVRIATYKSLNRLRTPKEILNFESELLDRFGLYPQEVDSLCQIMRIRTMAHALHATHLDFFPGRMTLQLRPTTPLSPEKILPLVGKSVLVDQKGKLSFIFESALKNPDLICKGKDVNHPELYDFTKCRDFLKKILSESGISLESA